MYKNNIGTDTLLSFILLNFNNADYTVPCIQSIQSTVTVPFEIIGLRSLAKRGWGIILHGASGRTWISDTRLASLSHRYHYLDAFHFDLWPLVEPLVDIWNV